MVLVVCTVVNLRSQAAFDAFFVDIVHDANDTVLLIAPIRIFLDRVFAGPVAPGHRRVNDDHVFRCWDHRPK